MSRGSPSASPPISTGVAEADAMAVNVLRVIRNGRLQPPVQNLPWAPARVDTSASAHFTFAGVTSLDTGDFDSAEQAWHAARRADRSFSGPLHLVLFCDGEPLERWSVTDFTLADVFGPGTALSAGEHRRALSSLVRIAYAHALLHPAAGRCTWWIAYAAENHPLHATVAERLSAGERTMSKQWSHVGCVRIRVDSAKQTMSLPVRPAARRDTSTPTSARVGHEHDDFVARMAHYASDMTAVPTPSEALTVDAQSILDACGPLLTS